jgi:hypothetical protein
MNDETGNNTCGNYTQIITTFSNTTECGTQENKQHIPLCRPWWVQMRKLECKVLGVVAFYWEYEKY